MDEVDADLALALQLQQEEEDRLQREGFHSITAVPRSSSAPISLIDPTWELADPNPDIRALFLQFNDQFFWGKLSGIEVKWSPRMTLCAGICVYEGRHGLCSVRLSEPLLKLRPRKDLVETLLHEMIHAYLFITDNNKDHDGHGPEFCKHMYRLNKATGANITVYHSFHDEVEEYRQHWWRCNGACRSRPPFFGYVKRALNRAPSSRDFWWEEHQRTCGGSYTKVKEPENYGKKPKKEAKKPDAPANTKKDSVDIRNFITGGDSGAKPVKSLLGGAGNQNSRTGQSDDLASTKPSVLLKPRSDSQSGNKTVETKPPTTGTALSTNKAILHTQKTNPIKDLCNKTKQPPSSTVTSEIIDLTSDRPTAEPSSLSSTSWPALPSLSGSSSSYSTGVEGDAVNWRRSDLPNARTSTVSSLDSSSRFPGSGFVLGHGADRKRLHSIDSDLAVPRQKVPKEVTGIEKFVSKSPRNVDGQNCGTAGNFPGSVYLLGDGQGHQGCGDLKPQGKLLHSSTAPINKTASTKKVTSSEKSSAASGNDNLTPSIAARVKPSSTDSASDPALLPCPVCSLKVRGAEMNSHLDACLKWD